VLSPAIYPTPDGQQQLMPGAQVGIALLKDTAKVNDYLSRPEIKSLIPSNLRLLWAVKPDQNQSTLSLYAIKVGAGETGAILSGDVITDARDEFNPQTNSPEVSMKMNSYGAKEWRRVTAKASQNKEAIAIVLDNVVYSAPTVQSEIAGGSSSISGNFTIEDTKDLANVLKS